MKNKYIDIFYFGGHLFESKSCKPRDLKFIKKHIDKESHITIRTATGKEAMWIIDHYKTAK